MSGKYETWDAVLTNAINGLNKQVLGAGLDPWVTNALEEIEKEAKS